MKIVKVCGGLGNQMFQYSFSRALEYKSQEEVFLDLSFYEYEKAHNGFELRQVFSNAQVRLATKENVQKYGTIPDTHWGKFRRKYATKKTHFIDKTFCYTKKLYGNNRIKYYEGWWQSEDYFTCIAEKIKEELAFTNKVTKDNVLLIEKYKELVAIHVRRKDAMINMDTHVCTTYYYERAREIIRTYTTNAVYLIFSDDIQWCRQFLDVQSSNAIFIDWNTGKNSWQDMWLMSQCKYHIIANSTFSWWGAWLCPVAEKVVLAPGRWSLSQTKLFSYYKYKFHRVVPDTWIRVPILDVR